MIVIYRKYRYLMFGTFLVLTDFARYVLIYLVTKKREIENIYDLRVFFVPRLLLGGRTNATH